jgi:hypothetical protein
MKKLILLVLVITVGVGSLAYSECVNQEKLIQDIKMCVQEARIRDPGFTAYLNPDTCKISQRGGYNWDTFWRAKEEFDACLHQAGHRLH